MKHSAILPTPNHAQIVLSVLPGNPNFAIHSVMIHNVSFDDASKISERIAMHRLSPLDWEPPITKPAEPAPQPVEVKPIEPPPEPST